MGSLPPAGWYRDPYPPQDPDSWRWWDGARWTDRTARTDEVLPVSRPLLSEAATRRLALAIAVASSLLLVVAVSLGLATLVLGRAVPVGPLVVLAVPVVAVGQVFAVALAIGRSRARGRPRSQLRSLAEGRRMAFGELRTGAVAAVFAGFFLCWFLAMSSMPFIGHGNPAHARPGCPYPLDNHGSITCVDRSEYDRAGASVERFAAGILAGFACFHVGAAVGALQRRLPRTSPPG